MVSRLIRFAAAGCCLLSLLACVGIGWVWLEARRGILWAADVSAARVQARGWSVPEWCGLSAAWPLPGRAHAHLGSADEPTYSLLCTAPMQEWSRIGLRGHYGAGRVV